MNSGPVAHARGDPTMMWSIEFTVVKTCRERRAAMRVQPSFHEITQNQHGELILLSIAANCLITLAQKDGLERAIERLIEVVMSRTQIHPESGG